MRKNNHKAIWIMIALHQLLGFIWYSPVLFLNAWLSGQGKTLVQTSMRDPLPYVWDFVTTIIAAYTLSWLTKKLGADTFLKGAWVGIIVFFGITFQAIAPHYKFFGMGNSVLFTDLGILFIWTVITTGVLASWKNKDFVKPVNVKF